MTEDDFIDMIVAAGLVVEDDETSYYVKPFFNTSYLFLVSKDTLAKYTEDDIAQILAFYTNAPKYRPLTLRGFFKLLFQRRTS